MEKFDFYVNTSTLYKNEITFRNEFSVTPIRLMRSTEPTEHNMQRDCNQSILELDLYSLYIRLFLYNLCLLQDYYEVVITKFKYVSQSCSDFRTLENFPLNYFNVIRNKLCLHRFFAF